MSEVADGLARAQVMLDLNRHDEAVSLLTQLVASDPDDGRAWTMLALAHLEARHYLESTSAANRAIALSPSSEWPHRVASIALRRMGNATEALRAANEACVLAPHEWRAHVCRAQAALTEQWGPGVLDAAEQAVDAALKLAPDEPDVHFVAGQVCLARGHAKDARAHQERALALDPAHGGALNELGRISLRRRGTARAAQHFVQAARTAPGWTPTVTTSMSPSAAWCP